MNEFMAEIRKIPPVTRTLAISSLVVTIPVLMKLVPGMWVIYLTEKALQKLQVWRFYTSFFLGPGGISYVFELVMLYRTADHLESGPYARRSADFAWQLLLVGASIIVLTRPLNAMVFSRPFMVALVYLQSALAPPGSQTSLMGLIALPIKYFPYVLIGMDLLMGGPAAADAAVAGAVAGHAWLWGIWGTSLDGAGPLAHYGRAPNWLKNFFGEGDRPPPPAGAPGAQMAAGGVHVMPPRKAATGSSSGHKWGSGQKLGTG